MSLLIALVLFLHVVRALSTDEVFGYLGENVTLPSGADPSWNISKIEWSILSNITWIATYRYGVTSINRFHRYKGRLSLDIPSGNLTIHNLRKDDALEYTVDLLGPKQEVKVIRLIISQRLKKPTIKVLFRLPTAEGCLVKLQCSSEDEGVVFSWTVLNESQAGRNISKLIKNDEEFTCTTSSTRESAYSTFTQKSDDPLCRKPRNRGMLCLPIGFAIGFVIPLVLYSCCGDETNSVKAPRTLTQQTSEHSRAAC